MTSAYRHRLYSRSVLMATQQPTAQNKGENYSPPAISIFWKGSLTQLEMRSGCSLSEISTLIVCFSPSLKLFGKIDFYHRDAGVRNIPVKIFVQFAKIQNVDLANYSKDSTANFGPYPASLIPSSSLYICSCLKNDLRWLPKFPFICLM